MREKSQRNQIRVVWFLLGCCIALLVSTVSLARQTGSWLENRDHILPPKYTKVCAEWEFSGVAAEENLFCNIAQIHLGTDNFSACQEAFRHTH